MDIISVPFAICALISIVLFYLLKPQLRLWYLAFLSCCFIVSYDLNLLIYVFLFSACNYYFGKKIEVSKNKKALFRTGLIINVLQLIILNYASFAIDPIFRLFDISSASSQISGIIVPLGISYFTLQGIGYLINIKMGWEKPESGFIDFLLYIIFFPKFLSGPIERSNHFLPQVKALKPFDDHQVMDGLKIALIGFFKKVVIANQLGTVVTGAYSDISNYSGSDLWFVVLIQPLYLYFDFSGYTDIAIGISKAYGIDLLPNFNKPFLAENVTTFWKRFHMSLSLWFNDYVFKQLSFKYRRWGKSAAVLAVFVTFTLFGIWHGAGWNFMILGLVQAIAINYEFFTKRERMKLFSKMPGFARIWSGRFFTYLFFGFSLVFFFAHDLNGAFDVIQGLFNLSLPLKFANLNLWFLLAICFALVILSLEFIDQDLTVVSVRVHNFWLNHRFIRVLIYYLMTILIMSHIGKKLVFIYQTF